MARIIDLKTFSDKRGNLTVIEKVLPFDIKRIFYIYGVDESVRGNHRHKKTVQGVVALTGECTIYSQSGPLMSVEQFLMNDPSKCLIVEPQDFHRMEGFSKDCILMVFASEYFDEGDYVLEGY